MHESKEKDLGVEQQFIKTVDAVLALVRAEVLKAYRDNPSKSLAIVAALAKTSQTLAGEVKAALQDSPTSSTDEVPTGTLDYLKIDLAIPANREKILAKLRDEADPMQQRDVFAICTNLMEANRTTQKYLAKKARMSMSNFKDYRRGTYPTPMVPDKFFIVKKTLIDLMQKMTA